VRSRSRALLCTRRHAYSKISNFLRDVVSSPFGGLAMTVMGVRMEILENANSLDSPV
jgi:hypothetical protein